MIISAASWQADLGILEQKLGEYFRRYFRGSLGLVNCQTLLDPHHLEGLYLMGVGWQTASILTVGKHKENWVVSTRWPRKAKRNTFSVFLTRWRMVSSDWLLEGWELQFCKPSAMLGGVRSQSLLIPRVQLTLFQLWRLLVLARSKWWWCPSIFIKGRWLLFSWLQISLLTSKAVVGGSPWLVLYKKKPARTDL